MKTLNKILAAVLFATIGHQAMAQTQTWTQQGTDQYKITSPLGTFTIGAGNSSYTHFLIGGVNMPPRYYFDKPIFLNGPYTSYSTNNLQFATANGLTPDVRMTILQANGNVGIGTGSPQCKFQVFETGIDQWGILTGDHVTNGLMLIPKVGNGSWNPVAVSGDLGIIFRNGNGNGGNAGLVIGPHSSNGGLRIAPSGNVGINTSSPQGRLHIYQYHAQCGALIQPEIRLERKCVDPTQTTHWDFNVGPGGYLSFIGNLNGANKNVFHLNANGNAILDGKLTCKEIKVQANPWADYVFAPGYKLMDLSDLEAYIQQHKHLPGIQTAESIHSEGLDVGAMNAKMMEKIEELTLYIIELKKEIDQLKK